MANVQAYEQKIETYPGINAGEDLSSYQYCGVKWSSGNAVKCDTQGESVLGILQNAPDASGKAAEIGYKGVSHVKLGGSVSQGNWLVIGASATLIASGTDPDEAVVAYALSDGSSGDEIPALITLGIVSSSAVAGRALADGKLFVGNASGEAAAVPMSGDATIDNTGAVTIAANAVEASMLGANLGKGVLNLPLGAFTEQDGTALADFADGASTTPGWSAGDESHGIRWNNHANPDPISTSVPTPPDFDNSANATLKILAAKTGATAGDAVTWLVEAFNNVDGALYDADADYGGTSSAMTGDATAKTCQLETLTLATANLPAAGGVIVLTIQPTDGTLGTDDVILLGAWIEYTRKS